MKKVTYKYINRRNVLVEEAFEFTWMDRCGYTIAFYNGHTHRHIIINDAQVVKIEDIDR